jgi:hypothetical protein
MSETRNIVLYKEDGRYGGWPANHGSWSWGNEIVVGFAAARYRFMPTGPSVDFSQAFEICQARSVDGGESWTIERPETIQNPVDDQPTPSRLHEPLDFTHPDFALMFKFANQHVGPSRFFTSNDRCRSWRGPYEFSVEGLDRVVARTDYMIRGERECIMFGSLAKSNDLEGRTFCARTIDGGLSWSPLAMIGPEPEGYLIMPSTVSLGGDRLLTTLRHKDTDSDGSIDAYLSEDAGATWSLLGEAASRIGSGNPPSLLALRDGRVCLTYGYRARPFGIRARTSTDQGATWSDEIILREDGLAEDLGYVRSVQRCDGKIVTAYYYNGPRHSDRTIQATIWTC